MFVRLVEKFRWRGWKSTVDGRRQDGTDILPGRVGAKTWVLVFSVAFMVLAKLHLPFLPAFATIDLITTTSSSTSSDLLRRLLGGLERLRDVVARRLGLR